MRRTRHASPDAADIFIAQAVRAFATRQPSPPPPGYEPWISRAVTAGVLAAVLTGQVEAGRELPPSVRTVRAQAAARHLRHLHDLRWVGDILEAAGVSWAALKGPLLRGLIFERPQGRDYADVDVLVSPLQIRTATETLIASGAVFLDQDWNSALSGRTAEVPLVLPHGSILDLHWSLFNLGEIRDGYHLTTADLLSTRTVVEVDGTALWTLDRVDVVMHVMLHACHSGGHRLRWALDVQQSLRWLGDDVDRLRARVLALGVRAPVRAAADLAQLFVDATVEPRRAAGRSTPWSLMLQTVSCYQPPSTPSLDVNGAHAWYAATRRTGGRSALALARYSAARVRYRRSGWPQPRPATAMLSDPGFRRWLDLAEATGR